MRMFTRTLMLAVLAGVCTAGTLSAQLGINQFRWFVGANGGALIYETPAQTRGAIPMAGGNVLITARRTALLLSVEEGFASSLQYSSYTDPSASGGSRLVSFNDLRRYSAVLMVYPLKSAIQPFLGAGFGLQYLHNPWPYGPFATPDEQANARQTAANLGSTGYGTFVAGLQLQAGAVALFGQYQITTSPPAGKLLIGPTHAFTGGLRVSLGGAKEGIASGAR